LLQFIKIYYFRLNLKKKPQLRGRVIRVRIQTPKKPNSARRPVVKVFLSIRKYAITHIPGIGHNLRRFSKVLVRGGGARDLPGVHTSVIRGKWDCACVYNRLNKRSKYGIRRPIDDNYRPRKKVRRFFKK
jgi:small subunit ribosomal protein S12